MKSWSAHSTLRNRLRMLIGNEPRIAERLEVQAMTAIAVLRKFSNLYLKVGISSYKSV